MSSGTSVEYKQFLKILEKENALREKIGRGALSPAEPYTGLTQIDPEDFQDIRKSIAARIKSNLKKRPNIGKLAGSHYLYSYRQDAYRIPSKYIEQDKFISVMLDPLPENLKQHFVLAGGSVLDIIRGVKVNDYDLFLVDGPYMEDDPVEWIKELLELWSPNIIFIYRSGNAISFNLKVAPLPRGFPEEEVKELKERISEHNQLQIPRLGTALGSDDSTMVKLQNIKRIMDAWQSDLLGMVGELEQLLEESEAGAGLQLASDKEVSESVPVVKVQIILRKYRLPTEVVHGFDLDASGFMYHEGKYYQTERAGHALKTMTQYLELSRASTTYNYRLVKYNITKSFRIYLPRAVPTKIAKDYRKMKSATDEGSLVGLLNLQYPSGPRKYDKEQPRESSSGKSDYFEPEGMEEQTRENRIYCRVSKGRIVSYGFYPEYVPIKYILDPSDILPGDRKIEPIQLIEVEPGRQWTGSFHPMDLNMDTWMGVSKKSTKKVPAKKAAGKKTVTKATSSSPSASSSKPSKPKSSKYEPKPKSPSDYELSPEFAVPSKPKPKSPSDYELSPEFTIPSKTSASSSKPITPSESTSSSKSKPKEKQNRMSKKKTLSSSSSPSSSSDSESSDF